MRSKKWIAAVTAAALLFSVTGCSGDDGEFWATDEATSDSETSGTAETAPAVTAGNAAEEYDNTGRVFRERRYAARAE